MARHISSKNHAHHSFSESFKLILAELLHEVKALAVEDRERLCNMEVFLNALIVVPNCPNANRVNMVGVV